MANDGNRSGRLILVRHGESEGNRDRTFTHSPEVPLTQRGEEQARIAGQRIAGGFNVRRVIASPYARAHRTAGIISSVLDLEVEVEPALHEQSFGELAGQPYDALLSHESYQNEPRWTWRPPGGESLEDVRARVLPAIERIARANPRTDVVVVSHGGVMLSICAHALGSWEDLSVTPNGGVVVIGHQQGRLGTPEPLTAD